MRRELGRPRGATEEASCETCGGDLRPDARYCDRCGAKVLPPPVFSQAKDAAKEFRQPVRVIPDWSPTSPLVSFPELMGFKKTWRPYQARVLTELGEHVQDRRMHVVAAPGSGKTVLGLEVARRLGGPALILSPTLAIRNQWIERLVTDFLPDGSEIPGWISTDVRQPEFLTVTTYQLLHSVCTGGAVEEEDEDRGDDNDDDQPPHETSPRSTNDPPIDVTGLLKKHGFRTLILDECHHLRNEWWKALFEVVGGLDQPWLVSLTATPPYDVPHGEWERYTHLCGPVDAEIAVPELVLQRNLCWHQDYVYMSLPREDEGERIKTFRADVRAFIEALKRDTTFSAALAAHPWVRNPQDHVEDILANPQYLSAIAVYLASVGAPLPRSLIRLIGVGESKLPALNEEWLEILLTGFLFDEAAAVPEQKQLSDSIERQLRKIGAIERRKVLLRNTAQIRRLMTWSLGKLSSIAEIVKIEGASLGRDLRLVILADYIRKAELPNDGHRSWRPTRIGVATIFETVRRSNTGDLRLAAVSGSLVILPRSCAVRLMELVLEFRVDIDATSLSPLPHASDYSLIPARSDLAGIVRIVTRLFEEGHINVLVGTKSLLGEGWDAPAMNSLILASFVGSYMLSNQMRGRAIRVQPNNPDKTANIWHLVCVERGSRHRGDDLETLARRFKAFLGVSYNEPLIVNGIGRLALPDPPYDADKVGAKNADTASRARDRKGVRLAWEVALGRGGDGVRLVEEIEAPGVALPRGFVFRNTVRAVVYQGLAVALTIWSLLTQGAGGLRSVEQYLVYVAIISLIAALVMLPFTLRAIWLFLMHGSIDSSMEQIGEALLETLTAIGRIKTEKNKLGVVATRGDQGTVFCHLNGGTTYEKHLYLDALREILDPVDNPRYIVVRRSWFTLIEQKDYHAVPECIGTNKQYAVYFASMWRKYVGPTKLIYTRSIKGRRALLKARQLSLASAFQRRSERTSCWK